MEAILFKITLWSFFAGMLAHFCALFPKQGSRAGRVFHSMALILVGLGFLSLSTAIIQRWASQGRVPISSSYEYLSLTAWFVAVLYFFVLYKVRKWAMFLGACISSGLFLNMIFAGMYPRKLEMTLIPALQSYWLKIHVSLTIVSEAVFALAFILGVLYLLKNYRPGRVSSRTRHLSLLLAIATELVGMSFLASLTLAGLVLQGVTGPML
ncbi:MAG: cytochrome c biogenesis protein CcsA, partial [Gemmatimonadota bacterium]|nr:cytochrome c biogenesis protein CcsA [Gemmatimonadota bacterium]